MECALWVLEPDSATCRLYELWEHHLTSLSICKMGPGVVPTIGLSKGLNETLADNALGTQSTIINNSVNDNRL